MTALTQVEIDLAAVRSNVRVLRELAGSAEFGAVVKANGYGLGAPEVARAALSAGADRLCVFSLDEAEALRQAGIGARVLVLGPIPSADADRAVRLEVAATVTRPETARSLAAAASVRPFPVHVKIDTGMYRLGAPRETANALIDLVRRQPELELEGFYTHFPNADLEDGTDTQRRLSVFLRAAEAAGAPLRHVANTATLLRFPQMALDLVRVGAGLYGFGVGAAAGPAAQSLRPVVRWQAQVVQIHDVAAGESVSYGGAWTAPAAARVGVAAVGYADGFRRRLSNRAAMLVRGRRVPVVGTVCMDLTLIDLSDLPDAAVGDTATLIGVDGEAEITIESFAEMCETIPYEVLTGLGPRPERRYLDGSPPDGEGEASAEAGLEQAPISSTPVSTT